ncbi:enolase C-terminal domain-like protein [Variovorax sp. KK3]|uniref:enolase C-terminal domain-like protein n=1 Tax=Variovorax sp. KK3 TaxID=1855728 RepID=UPI00097BD73D|nr:enolase C-terminal domain-like protein [Variovorax sp. KK3]
MTAPKIVEVIARAVNVPLEYPVRTSVAVVDTAPLVLIDMKTDAGVTGRSYVFTYTPLALAATLEMTCALGKLITGLPVAPAALDAVFASRLRLLGKTGLTQMATSGLDMAAWDAWAQHLKQPLARVLGGDLKPVPAYDSHSLDGIELGCQRAEVSARAGYGAIKTKLGYATLEEDIAVLRALRKTVGPDTRILADYNQGLTVPEAIRRIRVLEAEHLGWIEEPTIQENLRGYAEIRKRTRVPVQMGENWLSPDEMQRAFEAGACELAMPDVMKIGGVTGWLKAAALAQVYGIPMSSHIFPEFSAHLLLVTPTAHYLERMDLAGPILASALRYENGSAVLDETPGVGISWNEPAVTRYAA